MKEVSAPCSSCLRQTTHKVLHERALTDEDPTTTYAMLECSGCHHVCLGEQVRFIPDGEVEHTRLASFHDCARRAVPPRRNGDPRSPWANNGFEGWRPWFLRKAARCVRESRIHLTIQRGAIKATLERRRRLRTTKACPLRVPQRGRSQMVCFRRSDLATDRSESFESSLKGP